MQKERLTRVLVKETGKVYIDVDDAVSDLSIQRNILIRLIKAQKPVNLKDGTKGHLEFTSLPTTEDKIDGRVRVIESGKFYRHIQDASEKTGITQEAIRRLIVSGKEGRAVDGEYVHFELITY